MSAPGSVNEGWSELNCVVKRTFILTYESAEEGMKVMSDVSDTETESTFTFAVPAKPPTKSELRTNKSNATGTVYR